MSTITVTPQYSVGIQGNTISVSCTSDGTSPTWPAPTVTTGFSSATFPPGSSGNPTATLSLTMSATASTDRYYSIDVRDGLGGIATIYVYIVASTITNDDIVFLKGNDGRYYLVTCGASAAPSFGAALQYNPTVLETAISTHSTADFFKAPLDTTYSTVTCYVMNMANLTLGLTRRS